LIEKLWCQDSNTNWCKNPLQTAVGCGKVNIAKFLFNSIQKHNINTWKYLLDLPYSYSPDDTPPPYFYGPDIHLYL